VCHVVSPTPWRLQSKGSQGFNAETQMVISPSMRFANRYFLTITARKMGVECRRKRWSPYPYRPRATVSRSESNHRTLRNHSPLPASDRHSGQNCSKKKRTNGIDPLVLVLPNFLLLQAAFPQTNYLLLKRSSVPYCLLFLRLVLLSAPLL
jgi:hypothetical protein